MRSALTSREAFERRSSPHRQALLLKKQTKSPLLQPGRPAGHSMAKENENHQGEGDREPLASKDSELPCRKWTNAAQMDDNKENEGADNNLCEPEKLTEKVEKPDTKSDVPPSADIDKVTSDLLQSRTDLLGRVQNLKKDLQDWRGKLDSQVKTYRQELGELRTTLNSEVEQLRNEFQALRTTLKKQLDVTNSLANLGSSSSPERLTAS